MNPGTLPSVLPSGTRLSVDVFDTLLLRQPVSERRRQLRIATLFAARLPDSPARPAPEPIYEARVEAQRWAYRVLDAVDADGEIKIGSIFQRQLQLLSLPAELAALLLEVEWEVERTVLLPNRPLIRWLRMQRSSGIPVIAVSDTALPGAALQTLIEAVAGTGVVDCIYSSADFGLSKRKGGLFPEVARRENIEIRDWIHLGDDRRADVERAQAAGLRAIHLPRTRLFVWRRKWDGVRFEMGRRRSPGSLGKPRQAVAGEDPRFAYGREIMGPILARYCQRLWLYLSFVDETKGAGVALFCARGGLNLRLVFETFLERLQLPLALPKADFMISRLIAARAAVLANAPEAWEELAYGFRDGTVAAAARALAQAQMTFDSAWDVPFQAETFVRLLKTTAAGEKLRSRLEEQNGFFARHLAAVARGSERLILCDTGLYGTTLRLLQAGFPALSWECVLLARCSYRKKIPAHFARTSGLIVERDGYDPFDASSCILRYWQFIENLFEPRLESVRTFAAVADGAVVSNLETPDWRQRLAESRSPMLAGALSYLAELPAQGWFERICRGERAAWPVLRKAILFPDRDDLELLSIDERSYDFGKEGKIRTLASHRAMSLREKLARFGKVLWREGLATQEFPVTGRAIQAGLEASYVARWALRAVGRR